MNNLVDLVESYKEKLPDGYHFILDEISSKIIIMKKQRTEYKKNYYHTKKDKLQEYHKEYEKNKRHSIKNKINPNLNNELTHLEV